MERGAKRLLMSTPGFNLRSTCLAHHPFCVNAHPFCVNAHFRRRSYRGRASRAAVTPSQRVRSDGRQSPLEHQTGWSIKRFVATTRRYRTKKFGARRQILAAADPLPHDLCDEPAKIGHAAVH
jgi:hypothetical protein